MTCPKRNRKKRLDMFVELTSVKGEPFLLNVAEIIVVTVAKKLVYVYYGDMEFITVKESFEEVKSLLNAKLL